VKVYKALELAIILDKILNVASKKCFTTKSFRPEILIIIFQDENVVPIVNLQVV